MNTTLLIAAAIIITIMLVSILLVSRSKKKMKNKKNELLEVYKAMISENELTIDKEDIMPGKILAIDYMKKTFIFIYSHDEPVYDLIDLDTITECNVMKTGYKFTNKRSGKTVPEEHINNIHLALSNRNSILVEIPLYSEIEDGQMEYTRLLGVAEKWKKEINAVLGTKASRN